MSTFKEMTDEQLALLYIDGNNKAFDELLARVQDKIFSYVMYLTKDEDMANDVFQDTFVKAIIKLKNGQYKDTGKFVFWVMRIAHNIPYLQSFPASGSLPMNQLFASGGQSIGASASVLPTNIRG